MYYSLTWYSLNIYIYKHILDYVRIILPITEQSSKGLTMLYIFSYSRQCSAELYTYDEESICKHFLDSMHNMWMMKILDFISYLLQARSILLTQYKWVWSLNGNLYRDPTIVLVRLNELWFVSTIALGRMCNKLILLEIYIHYLSYPSINYRYKSGINLDPITKRAILQSARSVFDRRPTLFDAKTVSQSKVLYLSKIGGDVLAMLLPYLIYETSYKAKAVKSTLIGRHRYSDEIFLMLRH